MPTTFGINGSTISPTPSEIKVTPPRHALHAGADGTSTVSKRTKGHIVEVTWGSAEAAVAAMAAIRTALGSLAAATLTWTDPTGTTTTAMTVVHEGLPAYLINVNMHYGKITHRFYET